MAPGWLRQFGALLAVQLLISTSHGIYAPIVSRHLAELGLSGTALTTWTGIAFAANFLAMIIMLPILGRLGDRIGRKPIMVWSGFGMAAVTSLMAFASHPAELTLLRFLQGCFTGILPFSNILVLTGAPRHRVAFSAGLMQMMGESGHVLGPILGAAAMTALAPRETFPLMSVLLVAGAVIVTLLVREPPRRPAPEAAKTNLIQDIAAIWRRKPFPHLLLGAFCTNFCITGTSPLLAFYIERAEHRWWEGGLNLGFALAVTSLAVILFSPLLGRVADRIGPPVLLKAATGLAIALSVIQAVTDSYGVIVVCRFLMGLCVAGMLPNIQAQIRRNVAPGMESRTYTIANAWQFTGSLAGPTIGGVIAGLLGIHGWFWAIALVFGVSLWQAHLAGLSAAAAPADRVKRPSAVQS
ncbi:MAG: MFS transporter [Thermobacillus sp.]|jgi:DHA1 family multidrug resistance protein-like MFS transporter|uniref:Major Facilitator Superfamily transporter n=1 Tax=Thermobacillus composti (strain DSM 18247 / JCM 13945 / KWC4) TaxID=717605 RepID=L0EDJ5_THECK|nr:MULTISPECIES: MFS transporter [Thermobacillus]AGA57240.1 Major Facilitator Superfamily transporter [Thermobacillus composti KWC4]REK56093.1 MAG: MFS transporter [Thermobacillus sp.]